MHDQINMIVKEHHTLTGSSGAVFSGCGKYRYRLWRIWDASLPRAVFCMMNPSTADEIENDPTVERCWRRTISWAHRGIHVGGVEVVNAFAWRETDSRLLPGLHAQGVDLVGPDNDAMIVATVAGAAIVVCAWGKPGALGGRGVQVLSLLRSAGVVPHALRLNADGSPQHPLYLPYEIGPFPMKDAA